MLSPPPVGTNELQQAYGSRGCVSGIADQVSRCMQRTDDRERGHGCVRLQGEEEEEAGNPLSALSHWHTHVPLPIPVILFLL